MAAPARRQAALEPWKDPQAQPFLRIRNVTKTFGSTYACDDVTLDIYRGEFFALLGGSGSGKSTLLRVLAGFEQPDRGSVEIDGVDVTALPPYERPVNMMFQSYALFPHLSVAENIAFGLRQQRMPRASIDERVGAMLELVKLNGFEHRRPDQLSGGQKQRVALARALAKQPKLLLLDEPLGALDRRLREHTQFELVNIQDQIGTTFVMVTHDQEEAMTMASRVAVMDAGRVVQVSTPAALYEYPGTRFVAEFIGAVNLVEGRVATQRGHLTLVQSGALGVELEAAYNLPLPQGTQVAVAVRPEKVDITPERPHAANVIRGKVVEIAYLGDVSLYHFETPSGQILRAQETHAARSADPHWDWGDELWLSWAAESCVLLTS